MRFSMPGLEAMPEDALRQTGGLLTKDERVRADALLKPPAALKPPTKPRAGRNRAGRNPGWNKQGGVTALTFDFGG
jgi:hypothetical protein